MLLSLFLQKLGSCLAKIGNLLQLLYVHDKEHPMKKVLYTFLITLICAGLPLQAMAPSTSESTRPVVILGGGVGALTAAIYLQRAGIQTTVLEGPTPGGAIAQSPNVHNWPGENEIDGFTLAEKIKQQAIANGAAVLAHEVTHVDFTNRPFTITTREVDAPQQSHHFQSDAVIIALGSKPNLLGVPGESGERGYWTKGVYSCAVCDGALYKGKTVAVIGGGDSAVLEADYLSKIAKKVYVVLRSDKFRTAEARRKDELIKRANVEVIYNTKVGEIYGDGHKVSHLKLSTKPDLPVDAVFIAIGATPNTALFASQIELDANKYIRLVNGQQTSMAGVFAIGDVADPLYKQAISAAGDGAKAALQVEHYLGSLPSQPSLQQIPHVTTAKMDNQAAEPIVDISSEAELEAAIQGEHNTPLLVDFYSPYCGPCRRLAPEMDQFAKKLQGKVRFIKVDASKLSEATEKFQIQGVPTVIVFDKKGKQMYRGTGLVEIRSIFTKVEETAR